MKNIFKKITSKKRYIIIIVVLVAALIFVLKGDRNSVEKHTISEQTFVQETRVAGQVNAEEEALLGFASSGRVIDLLVNIGDTVKEGQVLARLDQSSASASVALAQANVSYESAKLNDVISNTQEELNTQKNIVSVKENDLKISEDKILQEIRESLRVSEDAVRLKADVLFEDPEGFAKIRPFSGNPDLKDDINKERRDFDNLFKKWSKDLFEIDDVLDITDEIILITEDNLDRVANYIDLLVLAVSYYDAETVGQSTVAAYKSGISIARTGLDSQISDFSSALNSYRSDINELDSERNKLNILISSSATSDLNAQQARLVAEQARLSDAKTLMSDAVIVAPFDGLVVERNIEEGETVLAGDIIISVVTEGEYKLESYIPEVFIGDVSEGDIARVIFESYPQQVFDGSVVFVEPKQTERDGISTYKTTLSFDAKDTLIRLGMTVDITIVTKEVENAISIPSDFVIINNAKTHALVERNGEVEEVEILLGGIDPNNNQEVLDGLSVGDVVIKNNE